MLSYSKLRSSKLLHFIGIGWTPREETSENQSQANRDNASYSPHDVEIYKLQMTNVEGNFTINAEFSKFNKPNSISLSNPRYKDLIQKYFHLKGI